MDSVHETGIYVSLGLWNNVFLKFLSSVVAVQAFDMEPLSIKCRDPKFSVLIGLLGMCRYCFSHYFCQK
jgi:hypothetical protein